MPSFYYFYLRIKSAKLVQSSRAHHFDAHAARGASRAYRASSTISTVKISGRNTGGIYIAVAWTQSATVKELYLQQYEDIEPATRLRVL